jgi:hypothetical protein
MRGGVNVIPRDLFGLSTVGLSIVMRRLSPHCHEGRPAQPGLFFTGFDVAVTAPNRH